MSILKDSDRMISRIDFELATELFAEAFAKVDEGVGFQGKRKSQARLIVLDNIDRDVTFQELTRAYFELLEKGLLPFINTLNKKFSVQSNWEPVDPDY